MAVSDDNVTTALTYLAADPHPLAVAKFELMKAENAAKQIYARLFMESNGASNDMRRAGAESNQLYIAAKGLEADCYFEVERHRERKNCADKLLDIYQTESANNRRADKFR